MKQKNIIENSKSDFFIIWANGRKFEDQILQTINENFKIIRLKRHKSLFFYLDVLKLYKYSFIQIYFLLKKLFYLRKYNKNFLAVEVINKKPLIKHNFNGVFRSYYCKKLITIKNKIRFKYQKKNLEEHIIHNTDTIHDYLAVNDVIGSQMKPFYGKYKETLKIELKDLFCIRTYGSTFRYKDKIIPLKDSAQYSYLVKRKDEYKEYLDKFLGTSIQFYHSPKKFDELLKSIRFSNKIKVNIIIKKKQDRFIILDGLHRASIFLFLGKKYINGDLYE